MSTAAILIAAGMPGCALWKTADNAQTVTADRPILPPIPAARDEVNLDVILVDRPAGDLFVGDALWNSLNQAAGSFAEHTRLQQAGVQFGVAPSSPPFALQRLLDAAQSSSSKGSLETRHQVSIWSGQTGLVNASRLVRTTIPSTNLTHPGPIPVTNAQCVFQVSAERVQEGWVRLRILPEILHGDEKLRVVATDRQYVNQNSQDVEQYFDQEFIAELNIGEYVVVGMTGNDAQSLGGLFFQSGDPQRRFQRLLIIRLAAMHQVQPVRMANR